jgi:hypothetical protein
VNAPISNSADVEILIAAAWDTAPVGASHSLQVFLRKTAGVQTDYGATLLHNVSDGKLYLSLIKQLATVTTTIAAGVVVGNSYTLGENWWIRFQVVGTTVRARAWEDGFSEPSTWQVVATDTDVTTGGEVGIKGLLGVGSSVAVTWSIDQVTIQHPVYGAGGMAVDAVTELALYQLLDADASASDTATPAFPSTNTDTGTGGDNASFNANYPVTDTASGADGASVTRIAWFVDDTGTADEAASLNFGVSDEGGIAGEDAVVQVALITADDFASGTDTVKRNRHAPDPANQIHLIQRPVDTIDVLIEDRELLLIQ